MGHAQKSTDSVLGGNNFVAVGWADVNQLRWAFRRRHGFALARWRERKRRVAQRRHRYRGARPPLRQLHAKLPEPDSARRQSDLSHCRSDRTVSLRPNLRRLVESEGLIRREGRRHAIGGTLSARDRTHWELRLRVQPHPRASFRFRNRISEFIYHYPR